MAVAFGSQGTFLTYGVHANSTLVAPSGIADGDLLIAYLAVGFGTSPTTVTPPAGWSTLPGSPIEQNVSGFFVKYHIFYKIASSESGNYTFTHFIGSYSSCGVVIRYTGVDTSTPFSPTPTTNLGTGTTATALGFTTTVANTFVIFTEQDWADNTNDTVVPTGTTPTFTERVDTVLIYIADGTLASAGATGNKGHTCNTTGGGWTAYLIGLKPATAPSGTTLTAAGGSYALTGTSAGIGGRAVADPGSYAITGTAATFAFKFTAEAATSSDSLTPGGDVNFVIAGAPVTLTALGGSYTLTGTSAGVGGKAIVDPGSYALTGTAMTWRLTAPVAAGAYTLTGTAATFLHGMIAGNSGYTVNGTDITFRITSGDYTLFCNSGSYALTGRDAAFPGNEPLPPVQPSTGSGYAGAWSGPKRRKRKRDEIEELIDAVIQAPLPRAQPFTAPQPPPPALVDLLPKMEAAGLTPPQRKIVKRAIVTDDPDDDDEAIELLLNLLS